MRNRTKEHALCQKISLVEDEVNVKDSKDPNDEAEEFEVNKDDWYFGVDRVCVARLSKPQGLYHLHVRPCSKERSQSRAERDTVQEIRPGRNLGECQTNTNISQYTSMYCLQCTVYTVLFTVNQTVWNSR